MKLSDLKFIQKKFKKEHSLDFSKSGKVYYVLTNEFFTISPTKYPEIQTSVLNKELENIFNDFKIDFLSILRPDSSHNRKKVKYSASGVDSYGRSFHINEFNKDLESRMDSILHNDVEYKQLDYIDYGIMPRSYFTYINGLCYPDLESDSWLTNKMIIFRCVCNENGCLRVYNHHTGIHYYLEPVSYEDIESYCSYIYIEKYSEFEDYDRKLLMGSVFNYHEPEPMQFVKISSWSKDKEGAGNCFFTYSLHNKENKKKTLKIHINGALQSYMSHELIYNEGESVENLYKVVRILK